MAFLLVFVFMTSPYSVSALDRVGGQFWAYNVSMPITGLNATGTVTYSLSGQGSVMANGVSYDCDILTISGNVSASSFLVGVPYSASAVLGGTQYESRGGISTISEDSLQLTTISIGSSPAQLLARIQTETITNYTPPFPSKFDPATTRPGDTWTEGVTLDMTRIINGTTVQSNSRLTTYNVVVASSMENIKVDAGTFQALKITMTDSTGARNVYWWSSKVQNFVVEKRYDALSSQPSTVLSLKEFDSSAGGGILIAVIVGVVLVAVAVLILVVLLSARRPRQPVHQSRHQVGVLGPRQMPPPTPPGAKAPGLIERKLKN
jgi:uncharacterized lipoprotein YbaY